MKRLITIIAIFIFLGSFASAQQGMNDNRGKFQLGIKAGGTYSNVYDVKGERFDADAKFGFTGGVFAAIPIVKFLGIQPEVLLTQKGFKRSGTVLTSPYSLKTTTLFVEFPILLAIKPVQFLTLLAGPQFSYLLKQRDKFTSEIQNFDYKQEFKQDHLRKNILGFVGGIDINLNNFVIGGRVGWDVRDNKGDGTSSKPRYKNVSTQLTLGYKIF